MTSKFDINTGEIVGEDEDFYHLIMWEGYDVSDGYFSDNYLKSLGLK